VTDRVTFLLGNLLQPVDHPVEVIVSNPPYVSHSELSQTAPEVQLYEPRQALDGGADGLAVIRQLLPQVGQKLKPGGVLLVEIGSNQGLPVCQLAASCFVNAEIELKKDLAGLDRLLVVRLN
jgi:release factor glutamine methyltransferase